VRAQISVIANESENLQQKNGSETLRASIYDAINGRENH